MTGRTARRVPAMRLGSLLCLLALVVPVRAATLPPAPPTGTPPPEPGSTQHSMAGACDGTTDASPAFQAAYDALTATGGTILVPAGTTCALGGAGVVPRANVALRCEKGSRIRALPGASALFRTTATLDDWSVTGCDLDLDGVAAVAWESSGGDQGGTRWAFRDNFVHGMPPGEGPPISAVRVDCTLASGPCRVERNTIIGSNSDRRRDTCLTLSAGGMISFATQIVGNYIQDCGGDCLRLLPPGGGVANDNVLVRCHDNAVDNSSLNSVWTGNQLATAGTAAGATMSIHDTIGNQVIVGNQFSMNPQARAPAVHAQSAAGQGVAGLYVDANYAAQGIFFDAKGRCAGGSCGGESCDDDGGCAACGGGCGEYGPFDHDHVSNLIVTGEIRVESATNLVVEGNVVIGRAPAGSSTQIALVNPSKEVPNGGIVIADNQLGKEVQPSVSASCIEVDDAGGGFSGLTITGNSCGEDPNLQPARRRTKSNAIGIRLARPPRLWRSVLITGNNFGSTKDALVGFDAPLVRAGTRLSGNLGLDAGDAEPVRAALNASGGALAQFSVVATAPDDLGAIAAVRGGPAAVGCAMAPAAEGSAVDVAVGGAADCSVLGAVGAIRPGDPLAPSAEPGHLAKAEPGERAFGYALESNRESQPLRVLIQPTVAGGSAATAPLVRLARATVRAQNDRPVAEPALAPQLEAGRSYAIDGHLRLRTSDEKSGVALGFGVPAATTLSVALGVAPGAAARTLLDAAATTVKLPLVVGENVVSLSGMVTTAAEGGALELRWAQASSTAAPLELQAGSWLRAMELP